MIGSPLAHCDAVNTRPSRLMLSSTCRSRVENKSSTRWGAMMDALRVVGKIILFPFLIVGTMIVAYWVFLPIMIGVIVVIGWLGSVVPSGDSHGAHGHSHSHSETEERRREERSREARPAPPRPRPAR